MAAPRFIRPPEIVYLAPTSDGGAPAGRGFYVTEPLSKTTRLLAGPFATEALATAAMRGVLRGSITVAPTLHERAMASTCPRCGPSCPCVAHQQLWWTYRCGVRVHADALTGKAA